MDEIVKSKRNRDLLLCRVVSKDLITILQSVPVVGGFEHPHVEADWFEAGMSRDALDFWEIFQSTCDYTDFVAAQALWSACHYLAR